MGLIKGELKSSFRIEYKVLRGLLSLTEGKAQWIDADVKFNFGTDYFDKVDHRDDYNQQMT